VQITTERTEKRIENIAIVYYGETTVFPVTRHTYGEYIRNGAGRRDRWKERKEGRNEGREEDGNGKDKSNGGEENERRYTENREG
jgi:hypothetical protein